MSGLNTVLSSIRESNGNLFAVEFPDRTEVVFSLPSNKQALQLAALLSLCETNSEKYLIYESIFKLCVKDDFIVNHGKDISAGIVDTIAKLVLYLSGVDSKTKDYTEELWHQYRGSLKDSRNHIAFMKRTICSAFPGYRFDILDGLDYQSLVEVFIHAEQLLIERGIMQGEVNFVDPEEQRKQEKLDVDKMIREDNPFAFDKENDQQRFRESKLREALVQKAQKEELEYHQRIAKLTNK